MTQPQTRLEVKTPRVEPGCVTFLCFLVVWYWGDNQLDRLNETLERLATAQEAINTCP